MMTDFRAIVFCKEGLLLQESAEGAWQFPSISQFDVPEESFSLADCKAFKVDDAAGMTAVGLRESWSQLTEADYALASKAAELLHWNSTVRFCSRCGAPLRRETEISKRCTKCNSEYFPQLNAAIVVLVRKGNEALLVRAKNFARPFYALVAGFVETGETLEQCVAREVKEETSLEIKDIRYFGSQAWPFPSQLMLGFTADYADGELKFADGEIADGRFFSRSDLPMLPMPPSLSRQIIDSWIEEGRND